MNSLVYTTTIPSPLGPLTLTATEHGLCGLYFQDHKDAPAHLATWQRDDGPRFDAARQWLTRYFAGQPQAKIPALEIVAGTAFQRHVWQALSAIPVGHSRTYTQIAHSIAAPSAVRAVATAIGRNPLSILVPCHRVLGANGALTGFAGGLERKRWLLEHEGVQLALKS